MYLCRWLPLLLVPFFFSGCLYYPFTYKNLEADKIRHPFEKLWVVDDPGNLSVSINDPKWNLSKLQVIHASFFNKSGKLIPILRIAYDEHYGGDFAIVKFYYEKGSYISGDPFSMALDISIEKERLRVSGEFSTHSHTEIEYLPEVLDHG